MLPFQKVNESLMMITVNILDLPAQLCKAEIFFQLHLNGAKAWWKAHTSCFTNIFKTLQTRSVQQYEVDGSNPNYPSNYHHSPERDNPSTR